MTGKNNKAQLKMTDIDYFAPVEKTNQSIQLDFIGPMRFMHRGFYILISIDRYSRFAKRLQEKQQKRFMKHDVTLNGLPQTIRTEKSTALLEKV